MTSPALLNAVKIVLVGTSHPGNIGGVARAMKNMGLSQLCLVAPRAQFPHPEADLRSSGATDLLEQAQIFERLEDAISDCTLVAGTSARSRNLPWPLINPNQLAGRLHEELRHQQHRVALVFGREDRGLSNEELHLCHLHVHIPCNPDFSSLNLAAAVQVLSYELRMACVGQTTDPEQPFGTEWDVPFADGKALELFFEHLEQTLIEIDFHNPDNPRQLMSRLRRLYLRARPDAMEINMLRGILTQTQKAARTPHGNN
ncbi:RNA methyltransferase [Marinospirillum alkaliphilum]|uniref:tRNA (cytidine/uridine-2'-O-)-methyltransferase TrmJ n=1 Tax=Marinospirillum alkaliphilum DSM 21637 TaxID=1122209 RepID=A0A1K1UY44_9GAMM|nr:RNA methyltransferase [Marinospirillum alkaliphilum]SFX17751.1 tRNA (cytidine32/uridine32-2'-O)-methyltransferase [Marinospirillum alkaliphilum DSM 21637]